MPYLPDLATVLADGARITRDDVEYVVEARAVGMVALPSGQVVGCDPLVDAVAAMPFTVAVAPGRYRLRAWVAAVHQSGSDKQDRTAALQLVVTDQPAVRWELALTDGQDPAELGADGFFGYPVDAGVGTLADMVAVQALARGSSTNWTRSTSRHRFLRHPPQSMPSPMNPPERT
ncbi:hypothetical protein Cme02nite_50820 [Catellatospora methionotrophica]|uniref:Uncharacterized protein n=2 Tax=Catellatospora methionotrophica TaxID=121620 RepID=A0A8J3LLF2_9ACTN|nr:hypothetical protein Cme02nite_50820 [Catellatospora methionotrophica]